MFDFFSDMNTLDTVFVICAGVGGLLFFVRTVLQLIGGIDADMDMDAGEMDVGDVDVGDVDVDSDGGDSDSSFRIFTVQGMTVFAMMFGLVGLCCHVSLGLPPIVSVIGGTLAGLACIWVMYKVMTYLLRLQSSGTLNPKNAVGAQGTVYLRIPAEGSGRVRVVVQDRLKVMDAKSSKKEDIKSGERIVVVDVVNNTLLVEKY